MNSSLLQKMVRRHGTLALVMALFFITAQNTSAQQPGAVYGKIKDSDSGELMVGTSIGIKGTNIGDATAPDGSFYIANVPSGDQILVIRSIGYTEQEIAITVASGKEVAVNVDMEPNTTNLQEIVVRGIRKSQIDAINVKRQSMNNKEVLKTNDIGRLPDINVAEAAQRIAGVSIETDNGEGRFISIRGIQPALNNVTLNNNNIGSTAGGRETPLDLLPVEMISSIEVTKANTPDMEGQGVGGAVNINTISAFDKAKPQFLIASFDGLIQNQQVEYLDDKFPFRAAVTGGKRFGEDEKFGVVVGANLFRRDFSVSILDPDRWQVLQGRDPNGNMTPGYLGPNEIEIQIEDNERDRYGLTADFEYRPTTFSKIYLRSLYTRTDEIDYNSEFELTVAGVNGGTGLPETETLFNQTPTSGSFRYGSGELDLSSGETKQNLYAFTLGGENRFGQNLTGEVYATWSRADRNQFDIDGTYENPRDTENQLAASYNTEPFFFDIIADNLDAARNQDLYVLRNLNIRDDNTVQEVMYELSTDWKYDLKVAGNPAYLKAGVRWRRREKEVDRSRFEWNDDSEDGLKVVDPYAVTQFGIVPPPSPGRGGTEPNVHGNAEDFRNFFINDFDRATWENGGSVAGTNSLNDTTKLYFRQDDTNDEVYDEDVFYSEDVTAGYLMGVIDFNWLTVIGGLRVEHTATTAKPWVETGVDTNLGFEQLEFGNDYTNWMPSVHLKAEPLPNLITRLSWTNTIGRPNYDDLSGTSEFEFMENADGTFTGQFEGATLI